MSVFAGSMSLERASYQGQLADLGDVLSEAYRGIFRDPEAFDPTMPGVTDTFTTQADEYSTRFDNVDTYSKYLSDAYQHVGFTDFASPRLILDVGVGSGSTTYLLLKQFPNARVVACDISAEMLQLVRRRLKDHAGLLDRCTTIQLDSECLRFEPGQFDLVVGAANLHHLFRPERTIAHCARILKPGALAIFFEPFEPGNALVALAMKQILNRLPRHGRVASKLMSLLRLTNGTAALRGVMEGYVWAVSHMVNPDKSLPVFQKMDDKWCFAPSYFTEEARKAGFSQTWIYPLHAAETSLENHARYLLKNNMGVDKHMPEWGWDVLRQFDRSFSATYKKELLIEGTVLFKK